MELGTGDRAHRRRLKKTCTSLCADNFTAELDKAGLVHQGLQWFAAPRRLALKVTALADAADKQVEKRGPAVSAAFDIASGTPTPAASGWAKSNGIEVAQAERLATDKVNG